MKTKLYVVLSILIFALQASAQNIADREYHPNRHPVLKKAKANSPDVAAFYKKDSIAFVTTAVIDKVAKKIYWFDCYGVYFYSMPIADIDIKAVLTKKIDAFEYFDLRSIYYANIVNKAKKNLQDNGKNAKFTELEKQLLQIDDPVKFPSTFTKLLNLDEQKLSVEDQLIEFHGKNPKYIAVDSIYTKTLECRYGKMQLSYKPDTTATFYNKIDIQPVYKAVLYPKEGIIDYYNRNEDIVDEIEITKERARLLLTEKFDVFALYRVWLEWQRQTVAEAIKKTKKLINVSENESSNKNTLYVQTKILAAFNFKINYFTDADKQFVLQSLRKEYSPLFTPPPPVTTVGTIYTYARGQKYYELTDQKGNVISVVTDKKIQHSSNGTTVDYYLPDVVSATDYYPFGMEQPGRTYNAEKYRYGFNGKEKDPNISKDDYDYGMRIYDARIARFLSVDPSQIKYQNLSPYVAFNDNPLYFKDPDGKNGIAAISGGDGSSGHPIIVTVTANYYYKEATEDQKSGMKEVKTELAAPKNVIGADGKSYQVVLNVSFIQSNDPDKSAEKDIGVNGKSYGNTLAITTSDSKQAKDDGASENTTKLGLAGNIYVDVFTDKITEQVDEYNGASIDKDEVAPILFHNVLTEEVLHNLGGLHQDNGALPGEYITPNEINQKNPEKTKYTAGNAAAILKRIDKPYHTDKKGTSNNIPNDASGTAGKVSTDKPRQPVQPSDEQTQ